MNFDGSHLVSVKQENVEGGEDLPGKRPSFESMGIPVVELSSNSESENEGEEQASGFSWLPQVRISRPIDELAGSPPNKRSRGEDGGVILPAGFLEPLPPERRTPERRESSGALVIAKSAGKASCKQFWKAGDYEDESISSRTASGGIDHVRVHPKFLHSNATSHKWALGAFAELLDNALDEVCNGATFVSVDMLKSQRDGSPMLLIEDDGGGMDPDKMRQCMSLGYSAKSKSANTIGQYGNGFKTSTMRLGADVIVFSRCCGRNGKSSTQSIGMLSYTFLRCTGHEDIVVPMLDYETQEGGAQKLIRSTIDDWKRNLETLLQWSPYSTEADLIHQFKGMRNQGTRIILYNLWEDDHGELELDFDADEHDIQVRGANRDEKKIQMAQRFPNSRHYLTYRHSLRSYASILYLRRPVGFRIILRGKDVEHHDLVDDLMYTQEVTYKPQGGPDIIPKETSMVAVVTIGFVKDAKDHIDVQGFNVYHKNRLIKPFWRIWNAAGSEGRGIIGVLEANFVEPAHDKQGFERTTVLARLESRLLQMQKNYWSKNCDKVGYVNKRGKKIGRDLVQIPREVRASECVVAAVMTPPVLKTRAEPIPLVTNSVPVVTGSSLGQAERRVHEAQHSGLNTVQVGKQNNLCQVLPKGISVLREESQQSQIREVSPQGLSNSNQETQELQRKSTPSEKCTVTGQQCLKPQLREYSQLESSRNQPVPEVQCTSPEPLVQVQDTSHMEMDTAPIFLQSSGPSSGVPSLLLSPTPRPHQQVELDETIETGSLITTTQILKFAEGAAISMIGSSSRDQNAIVDTEIGLRLEDASAQNVIAGIGLGSNSMNESVTINGNFGSIDSQSLEEIEGQNIQLKDRIQKLEESQIRSIQMEVERGEIAETNVVGAVIELSSGAQNIIVGANSESRFEAQNINVGTKIGSSSGAQTAIAGAEIGSISSAQNLTSVEIGTSYRDQNVIASVAIGSSSRDENAFRGVEFNTNATNDNVINNDNYSLFDHQTLKQLEEENKQLKKRIQTLEEIHLQSIRMEHERKRNLEAHILDMEQKIRTGQRNLENTSKYKETINAVFSAERMQRDAQEEELRNKLKTALLRIHELERENNELRLAQNQHN